MEIPLNIAVTKYFGFTPVRLSESALNLANPKYLVTNFQAGRYYLEDTGIAGNEYFRHSLMTILIS
ncbi:hypothetical protein ACFL7M_00455 [Thermodesulfobacteriota bacterium]